MTPGTATSPTTTAAVIRRVGRRSDTTEESLGAEQQDEDDGDEADGVLPARRQVAGAQAFGKTEQQAARDRADEASHEAEHNDDQGLQRRDTAHARLDRDERTEHGAGGGRETGPEGERVHVDAVDT